MIYSQRNKGRLIRRWFILIFFVFISACTTITSSIKPNTPQITFKETTYDFLFAGPERKISHTFRFTNTGSQDLNILRVTTDCESTAAVVSSKKIVPGQSGAIRAFFETKKYLGKQEKIITVYSNDPDNPELELKIRGIIKRGIAFVPNSVSFRNVKKSRTKRIKLLMLSEDDLIIRKIEADNNFFKTRSTRFEDENSQGYNIDITLRAFVSNGSFFKVITLHTNRKRQPRIDIPVFGNIKN